MSYDTIRYALDAHGVATLTLHRPHARNAVCAQLCDEMMSALSDAAADEQVRVLVLTGTGSVFSAGADLRDFDRPLLADCVEAAKRTVTWLKRLRAFPKPTVGRINGDAFGAGLGIVAVCDIAVGLEEATFTFSETRLGLTPNLIAPFVIEKIGASNASWRMLSAEVFTAREGQAMGLLHRVVPSAQLDEAVENQVAALLKCAPGAVSATKALIGVILTASEQEIEAYTVDKAAHMWATSEAREGIESFKAKRKPSWRVE